MTTGTEEKAIRLICPYEEALDILQMGGSTSPAYDLFIGLLDGQVGYDEDKDGKVMVVFYE